MLADEELTSIISLQLLPYGNTAYDSDSGVFTCQHGDGECSSDIYEQCLMYKLGDASSIESGDTALAAWPFILCMETADGDPTHAESCYSSSMGNSTAPAFSVIQDCHDNEAELVQTMAMKATDKLDHTYVPWVVVDGTVLAHNELLKAAICKAYTGPLPSTCRGTSTRVTSTKTAAVPELRCPK